MSQKIISFLIFFLFISAIASQAQEKNCVLIDRCVAVVNDEIITLTELEEEAAPTLEKIREHAPPSQLDAAIEKARKDILSEMIDRKLLTQRAEKRGVDVSDGEIDAAIDRILEQNNLPIEEFRSQLASMGTTEGKYRVNLKSQIIRSKLINYEIRSKVVITNEQIETYYRNMDLHKDTSEGYHILQFGISWGSQGRSASREEAEKRAEQLREMIIAGENFNELAKNYSDLPSAEDGGDIGIFRKDELASYMWGAIKDLRPGDVSSAIETPSGFQFFKLISSSQAGVIAQAPLENMREEIRSTLYEKELKSKFDEWVRLLRDNSYVQELL